MKKILFTLSALAVISCAQEPVDYSLINGQITNSSSEKISLYSGRNVVKDITVSDDGSFSDTLRLEDGKYMWYDGKNPTGIYVKKGKHIVMHADAKNFSETLRFTGDTPKANEYFLSVNNLQKNLDFETLISGNQEKFDSGVAAFKSDYLALLKDAETLLDSTTVANQTKELEALSMQLIQIYAEKNKNKSLVGKPAMNFEYDNYKGGKTSLADLKGKYVYIDVWATWCGPCKKEIPFLKEIEQKYHDKNIVFVSLSVDNERAHKGSMEKAIAAWKAMVADKELGGIQLHFGGDESFSKFYNITGIPRFILIDPNGNIVEPDAPRPSSPLLIDLLSAQGL